MFLSICATGKAWGLGSTGVLDFLCCFAKVPFVLVRGITKYGRVGMQSLITALVSLYVFIIMNCFGRLNSFLDVDEAANV